GVICEPAASTSGIITRFTDRCSKGIGSNSPVCREAANALSKEPQAPTIAASPNAEARAAFPLEVFTMPVE
ncbi:MAG TPA: hypothetical protein DEO88_15650, partial [Syntrophobacteraceae bacterium]|nr:hypothetical protein [Syntrophobacteraceae bacterium]